MLQLGKKEVNQLIELDESNEKLIRQLWSEVLDAAGINQLITNSDLLFELVEKIKKERHESNITVEQISQRCLEIHKNILNNLPGNCEIDLNKHIFVDSTGIRELEDILIKMRTMDGTTTEFLYLNTKQVLDTVFFLGGSNKKAYFISKDECGKLECAELMDFYLLSLTKDKEKEFGFLVSYHWLNAKLESTILAGYNLEILKSFILSEWFQMLMSQGEKNEEIQEEKAI